jgi:hypothetical protein
MLAFPAHRQGIIFQQSGQDRLDHCAIFVAETGTRRNLQIHAAKADMVTVTTRCLMPVVSGPRLVISPSPLTHLVICARVTSTRSSLKAGYGVTRPRPPMGDAGIAVRLLLGLGFSLAESGAPRHAAVPIAFRIDRGQFNLPPLSLASVHYRSELLPPGHSDP